MSREPDPPSAPTHSIPYEIMSRIFISCLPQDGRVRPNPYAAPLLLAQICAHWRAIALSTPQLWASVALGTNLRYYDPLMDHAVVIMSSWFARAAHSPVSITLSIPGRHLPEGLLALIKSYSPRWRRLEISLSKQDFLELITVTGPFPALEVLTMDTDYRWEGDCANYILPFFDSNKLGILRLSPAFAGFHRIQSEQRLINVIALECWVGVATLDSDIRHIFARFPNLRHLVVTTLELLKGSTSPAPPSAISPPIHSLTLYYRLKLLDYLTLPTLQDLTLISPDPSEIILLMRFVARSTCTITYLTLQLPYETDGNTFVSIIQHTPHVTSLTLCFPWAAPAEGSAFLIVCPSLSRPAALPKLRDVNIQSTVTPAVWDAFLCLLRGRQTTLRSAALTEPTRHRKTRIPPVAPTPEQRASFAALADDAGMRIDLAMQDGSTLHWPEVDDERPLGLGADPEEFNFFRSNRPLASGCSSMGWYSADLH